MGVEDRTKSESDRLWQQMRDAKLIAAACRGPVDGCACKLTAEYTTARFFEYARSVVAAV